MQTAIPISFGKDKRVKYIYELHKKIYYAVHPILWDFYQLDIKNQLTKEAINNVSFPYKDLSLSELEYYLQKYHYLKSKCFFSEKNYNKELQGELTSANVENILSNLNNIVFEVTDACNLKCKYCGYGDMYYDHDERKNTFLPINSVKKMMGFLSPYLSQSDGTLYIGFYGGEPLLNMNMIKESVKFIKNFITGRDICFSMTTNGILLNKYIDFLVAYKFKLLVSIDGNEFNHSYRVFHSGENSFQVLYENLKMIQKKYPEYFDKWVTFNAVIHNRNSVVETHSFLMREFNKITKFSPLDDAGINPDKLIEFKSMHNDIYKELQSINNIEKMISERFINDPNVFRLSIFLKTRLANTRYNCYEDLFAKEIRRIPGGTCLPFQKKLFVTVNNKILVCERINQNYVLGYVEEDKINLDFSEIANTYNEYYRKIKNQCSHCYSADSCSQCFFQIDNFLEHYKCHAFTDIFFFSKSLSEIIDFLEFHPTLPKKIINEVILK
jgi:uncharacterized protein